MNDEKRPEGEADKLYEQTVKNLLKTPPVKKQDGGKRHKSGKDSESQRRA